MAGIIFVAYPALVLIPILIFITAFYKLRVKFFLIVAASFALYPIYEFWVSKTCPPEECNIRADLIFIYIGLETLLFIGILVLIIKLMKRVKQNNLN